MLRRTFLISALAALAAPAQAAPRQYRIGPNGADITYTFLLQGAPVRGRVPLSAADLRIDPNRLTNSTADVRADMRRAKTGLGFATEAMKSPSVLAADEFPESRFTSTRVILGPSGRLSDGAVIEGRLTLRGVTRPIRLNASVYRARGSAADDFSQLSVELTGQISRGAFGASGYPNLVADDVSLLIKADIRAV